MRIAAAPSSTTYRPDPLRPWRRIFSPSPNHCSLKTSATCSRCGVVRSANSAKPAMVSASSWPAIGVSGLADHLVVDEAVQPALAWLERPDDRVAARPSVGTRVAGRLGERRVGEEGRSRWSAYH